MAKVLVTTTGYNAPRNGNRAVFDMGGTYYVILRGSNVIRAFKKTNGSFTEYSKTTGTDDVIYDIAPVKLSSTVIRVFLYIYDNSATDFVICYFDLDTSTDTWGNQINVQTGLDAATVTRHISASVDKSGYCHVIYTECVTYHGTDYDQIMYTENSGGWSIPLQITIANTSNHDNMSCCHDNDDTNGRFCCAWEEGPYPIRHRSRSSAGAWDSFMTISTEASLPCIIIAASNVKKVAIKDPGSRLDVRSGISGATPTWSDDGTDLDTLLGEPSITNESFDDVLRVFYNETGVKDILLVEKDGTWGSPQTLQSHASDVYEQVRAEYPHGSDEIGYVFYDYTNTDWYFDVYVLAPPAPVPRYGFVNFQDPGTV